jgi:hypothetical protein
MTWSLRTCRTTIEDDKHVHYLNFLAKMGRVALPSRQEIAAPFQSKAAFVDFLRAPQGNEAQTTFDPRWSNKDLEPTPEQDRTWTW